MRETGTSNKLSESWHDGNVSLFDSTYQQTCIYKWRELRLTEDTSDFPRRRSKHGTCRLGDYMYMFGGKDMAVSLKDFWRYSLEKNKWERVSYRGEKLPHLEAFSMLSHRRLIYIFGGEFSPSRDETPLWIYNTDLQYLRKVTTETGQPHPSGRRDHSAVIYEDAMYIYGGFTDVTGSSSELWKFSFDSEKWELVSCVPEGEEGPGARHGHTAIVYDKSMWVYGGMTDLMHKPELWTYSFKQQKWTRIRARLSPPPLTGHTTDVIGDSMFILGGDNCGQLQSTMWRFRFESQTWARVDFPSGVFSSRGHHCTALVLPPRLSDSEKETTRSVSLPALQRRERQSAGMPERPRTSPAGYTRLPQPSNVVVFNNRVYPNDSSSTSSSRASTPNDVKAVRELGDGCFTGSSSADETIELSTFSSESSHVVISDKLSLLPSMRTLCDSDSGADNPEYMASPSVTGDFKVFDSFAVDKKPPETPVIPVGYLVDISIPADSSTAKIPSNCQASSESRRLCSETVGQRRSFSADDLVLEDLELGGTEISDQDELVYSSKLPHSATFSGKLSQTLSVCPSVSGKLSQMPNTSQSVSGKVSQMSSMPQSVSKKLSQMSDASQPVSGKLSQLSGTHGPVIGRLSNPSGHATRQREQARNNNLTERATPVWKSKGSNSDQGASFSSVCAEERQSSRSYDNTVQRTASHTCQKPSERAPSYVLQDRACIYVFGGREGSRRELGKTPVSVLRCEIPLTS